MPVYIVKLTDKKTDTPYYMEWSTVTDSPATYGMPLDEFKEHYKDQYGARGMEELPKRLKRVEESGCSDAIDRSPVEEWITSNRAGEWTGRWTAEKGGTVCLSYEELVQIYCIDRPDDENEE